MSAISTIDFKELKKEKDELVVRAGYLQRLIMAKKIPVMIVFEGVHASGKGRLSNELLLALDARYTDFYATHKPTEDELRRPLLWQYSVNAPTYGNINIYYRSWYSLYIALINQKFELNRYTDKKSLVKEIRDFEKTLIDDGTVLIKFYLNISKDKQMEHLRKMRENPRTMWRAQEYDAENDERYEQEMKKLLKDGNHSEAPWHHIEYDVRERAVNEMLKVVTSVLEKAIAEHDRKSSEPKERDGKFKGTKDGALDGFDKCITIDKKDYREKLENLQQRMREVQYTLYQKKVPLFVVYEGWDAGGKGGNIKRLVEPLDPTMYIVNTTAAPNETERNHNYLWRFWTTIPKSGYIAIYDRSWYGRLMVERVEGFATNQEWSRAYQEINDFEESQTNFGAIVIKLFLYISKEEQLTRFEDRQSDPNKVWKITDEDWRNREKWDIYVEAVNDMIDKTNRKTAPWIVINGNDKRYARVKALETIVEICEKKLYEKNGK